MRTSGPSMAPDTGAGGSHPLATTDPEEGDGRRKERQKSSQTGEWTLRPVRERQKWQTVDVEPEEEEGKWRSRR